MTNTVDVGLEPLTAATFEPYGWLLGAPDGPADFERPGLWNWRLPFNSDAKLRLQVMRYEFQEMRLSRFEKHIRVTEARTDRLCACGFDCGGRSGKRSAANRRVRAGVSVGWVRRHYVSSGDLAWAGLFSSAATICGLPFPQRQRD